VIVNTVLADTVLADTVPASSGIALRALVYSHSAMVVTLSNIIS
jgi:hypothetical protein